MNAPVFYIGGRTRAIEFAQKQLLDLGYTFSEKPDSSVSHLLLGVPAFAPDNALNGGGDLEKLLAALPRDVTVIGGNLDHPSLQSYRRMDLLQDPYYLAENANITAYCALKPAMDSLPVILQGLPVLVIGWGRIGKCLARLLKNMGVSVTVAARKAQDRACILSLGYDTADSGCLTRQLQRYRMIFNTVPAPVLPESTACMCREDCIKIDLASKPGILHKDAIQARGLPGKHTPESSGALITRSILRLQHNEERSSTE